MSQYVFSDDDQLFPVYCLQCKKHIPKAVSNANSGVCDDCLSLNAAAAVASAAATQHQNQAAYQAVYSVNTGLGKCPQCGSTNITEFTEMRKTNAVYLQGTGVAAIVIGIPLILACGFGLIVSAIGLIMLIVGLCMPKEVPAGGPSRGCNTCGHRWAV